MSTTEAILVQFGYASDANVNMIIGFALLAVLFVFGTIVYALQESETSIKRGLTAGGVGIIASLVTAIILLFAVYMTWLPVSESFVTFVTVWMSIFVAISILGGIGSLIALFFAAISAPFRKMGWL